MISSMTRGRLLASVALSTLALNGGTFDHARARNQAAGERGKSA